MELVWQEKNGAWNNKTLKTQCECNSYISDMIRLIKSLLFIRYSNWSNNKGALNSYIDR